MDKKEILNLIHSSRKVNFRKNDVPIEKKIYFITKKDDREIFFASIFFLFVSVLCGFFLEKYLEYIILILAIPYMSYIMKFSKPALKLNEKGIYFRNQHIKWTEITGKIRVSFKDFRVKISLSQKGKTIEKEFYKLDFFQFWKIFDAMRDFKKKYRQPYIYRKNNEFV